MLTIVSVAGMRTEHCKRAVFTSLTPVGGIRAVTVALGEVIIEHDEAIDTAAVRDAIATAGYEVTGVSSRRLSVIGGTS